jgi:hypothetical protein
MSIELTDVARAFLRERRAEAVRIVTGGDQYTESQRRLAWRVLSDMPLRMGAMPPQSSAGNHEPPAAA